MTLLASKRAMLFGLALVLGLAGVTGTAAAQDCPDNRYCYYVPPQTVSAGSAHGRRLTIINPAEVPVNGTYQLGNNAPVPFTQGPSSILNIALSGSSPGVASGFNTLEARGVYVEADGRLQVDSRTDGGSEQQIATVKESRAALGTRFRVGGYSLNGAYGGATGHDSISVYSPTAATVTVTAPPGWAGNFWQDFTESSATVSLGAGQTIVFRGPADVCGGDIDGALVTSSAPIAVTSGGRGRGGTCGIPDCFNGEGVDGIVPTDRLGTEFAIVDLWNTDSGADEVSVVADVAGTEVLLNGTLVATLGEGEVFYFTPPDRGVAHIESTEPVAVFYRPTSGGCAVGLGFVPPLEFPGVAPTRVVFQHTFNGKVAVLLPTSARESLLQNGSPIETTNDRVVPGRPDVTVVEFSRTHEVVTLTADTDFQVGFTHNGDQSASTSFLGSSGYRIPGCGDGVVAGGEECDDGGVVDGDGCSASCTDEKGCASGTDNCDECGDGIVVGVESCDDANGVSGDGCSSICEVEPGYACVGQPSACMRSSCGDGIVSMDETCDDQNTSDNDGCSASCEVEDGFVCTGAPSVCSFSFDGSGGGNGGCAVRSGASDSERPLFALLTLIGLALIAQRRRRANKGL